MRANGFARLKREDVTLQVKSPATMNFTMQVATTRVEVEVTSEAPLVNEQDASIGNAFNARQLVDLPSEGRDSVSILSLQPGVTYIGGVDQTNDSRGGTVAGAQRPDQPHLGWLGQQRSAHGQLPIARAIEAGQAYQIPDIQFVLSGQANGEQPYWRWDYKDIAPVPRHVLFHTALNCPGWRGSEVGGWGLGLQ